ncbi:MAG: 4Fe-4S binding protein [Oscillospiraceae bacterium]|nr:4Fe-4S binding protein [Oscillospiraceae bacterium]
MPTIAAVYFSATGNTKKNALALAQGVAEALASHAVEDIDLTNQPSPAAREFSADDFVIFGMPVYAGRVPSAVKGRFSAFRGNGTPCLVAVSYGNRHYDDALLEMARMAEEQGFVVKGGAALIGRHTFGDIQMDRPDAADLEACRAFGEQAVRRDGETPAIPGAFPHREGGSGGKFRPLTADTCVNCGLCARKCPMQAIGEDFRTVSEACISCFRCIRNCPVGAKNMDVPAYNDFAAMFTEKLKARRENEFF